MVFAMGKIELCVHENKSICEIFISMCVGFEILPIEEDFGGFCAIQTFPLGSVMRSYLLQPACGKI